MNKSFSIQVVLAIGLLRTESLCIAKDSHCHIWHYRRTQLMSENIKYGTQCLEVWLCLNRLIKIKIILKYVYYADKLLNKAVKKKDNHLNPAN